MNALLQMRRLSLREVGSLFTRLESGRPGSQAIGPLSLSFSPVYCDISPFLSTQCFVEDDNVIFYVNSPEIKKSLKFGSIEHLLTGLKKNNYIPVFITY